MADGIESNSSAGSTSSIIDGRRRRTRYESSSERELARLPAKYRAATRKFWRLLQTAADAEMVVLREGTLRRLRRKPAARLGRPPKDEWQTAGLAMEVVGLMMSHPDWAKDRILSVAVKLPRVVDLMQADGLTEEGMKTRLRRWWLEIDEFARTVRSFDDCWLGRMARAIPDIATAEREGRFAFDDDEYASVIWQRWCALNQIAS